MSDYCSVSVRNLIWTAVDISLVMQWMDDTFKTHFVSQIERQNYAIEPRCDKIMYQILNYNR